MLNTIRVKNIWTSRAGWGTDQKFPWTLSIRHGAFQSSFSQNTKKYSLPHTVPALYSIIIRVPSNFQTNFSEQQSPGQDWKMVISIQLNGTERSTDQAWKKPPGLARELWASQGQAKVLRARARLSHPTACCAKLFSAAVRRAFIIWRKKNCESRY